MNTEELNNAELGFIRIVRAFHFLLEEGYQGVQFSVQGLSPSVCFENPATKHRITIFWSEEGCIDIEFQKTDSSKEKIPIREYYKRFNCEHLVSKFAFSVPVLLNIHANFIRQYLLPEILKLINKDKTIPKSFKTLGQFFHLFFRTANRLSLPIPKVD